MLKGNFSNNFNRALAIAKDASSKLGCVYIGTEHLVFGILNLPDTLACKVLVDNGVKIADYANLLREVSDPSYRYDGFTPLTKQAVENSIMYAVESGETIVGVEHLLIAILIDNESLATMMISKLSNLDKIKFDLINLIKGMADGKAQKKQPTQGYTIFADEEENAEGKDFLSKLGTNLCDKARAGKLDPVIGREKEIDRVIQILSRRTKNNPILIGEPGVGKSAIVEGLAQNIVSDNVPDLLKDKIIFSLDISSMLAGTKYRGDFEERLNNALAEIKKQGNIILFIDEIHNLVGAGSTNDGKMDMADILKPMLARGELQTIGATTIDEYRKYIEKDTALERRFQPILVEAPNVENSILILKGLRDKYEAHHKIKISDEAIVSACELSDRYIMDRFLPDKAIDLIDEACSRAKLNSFTTPQNIKQKELEIARLEQEKRTASVTDNFEKASELRDKILTLRKEIDNIKIANNKNAKEMSGIIGEQEIADVVSQWTNIPVTKLTDTEANKLLHLEAELHKQVIGQDEAVSSVAKAIRRARTGLKDTKRPIGSFVFVGPSGVGKTELSKALSVCMFGSTNALIRVDMSEYMEKHSVSKLIGAPPGYVGYEESGGLTEKIRRKPYSVVLFDEVEKAHPDVFNMLLQILDDGQLTDSKGRLVSFKNCIIIMTSNLGTEQLGKITHLGFEQQKESQEYDRIKERTSQALKNYFRPEFLNRIDEIIVFHSLTQNDMLKILDLLIADLKERLKTKKLDIAFTEKAKTFLIQGGYDKEYGARPLKRFIQRQVEDKMSEEILMGKIKEGQSVVVDEKNGEITFRVIK